MISFYWFYCLLSGLLHIQIHVLHYFRVLNLSQVSSEREKEVNSLLSRPVIYGKVEESSISPRFNKTTFWACDTSFHVEDDGFHVNSVLFFSLQSEKCRFLARVQENSLSRTFVNPLLPLEFARGSTPFARKKRAHESREIRLRDGRDSCPPACPIRSEKSQVHERRRPGL